MTYWQTCVQSNPAIRLRETREVISFSNFFLRIILSQAYLTLSCYVTVKRWNVSIVNKINTNILMIQRKRFSVSASYCIEAYEIASLKIQINFTFLLLYVYVEIFSKINIEFYIFNFPNWIYNYFNKNCVMINNDA